MNSTLLIFILSSSIVTLTSSVSLSSVSLRGGGYDEIEKNVELTLDEDYLGDYLDDDEDAAYYPNLHQKDEQQPEPDASNNPNPCTTFCYSSSNKCCGYSSSHWGSICKSGKSQSPINLPLCQVKSSLPNKELYLDGDLYKGKFSLENDGHTVIARFLEKDKLVELTSSSNSEAARGGFYILDSVRFRWGKEDAWGGAEHCVKVASASGNGTEPCVREAMEVQFYHFKSDKSSFDKALASNQKDAVLVISMFLRVVNSSSSSNNNKGNRTEPILHPPVYPVLNPLLKQLDSIAEYGSNVTVKSTLDFTPWISYPNVASTYHGSMTTPSCRQVVKWVVLQQPMSVKLADVAPFKGIKGIGDKAVRRNRRPYQKRNKREVGCFVFGVLNAE